MDGEHSNRKERTPQESCTEPTQERHRAGILPMSSREHGEGKRLSPGLCRKPQPQDPNKERAEENGSLSQCSSDSTVPSLNRTTRVARSTMRASWVATTTAIRRSMTSSRRRSNSSSAARESR